MLSHEMPWLIGIHCVAHVLELAAKDAFRDTFYTKEVCDLHFISMSKKNKCTKFKDIMLRCLTKYSII